MWSIPVPWNLRFQPELWFFTKEGEFSPKKGDIITFHNGDTVVTHRVVKKEKDIFITKGDANKTEDPVPADGVTDHRAGSLSPRLIWLRDFHF